MIKLTIIKYTNANALEATWADEDDKRVHCQAYADVQMDMLRSDVARLGGDLTEYEPLLAEVEANIQPADPILVQVPQAITIRQAKLVLLSAGLLDDVDAAIAQADRATQIEWEYATEVHRNWSTLRSVQGAVGLTDEQVDELFIRAASL